jgi:hypothetical protein
MGASGCHAPGTKVITYNGSLKKVENVELGDKLLGPGGGSRTVMRLFNGTDKMYKIIPCTREPFVVNGDHVLSLKCVVDKGKKYKKGRVVNMTVEEYLDQNPHFKRNYKLYQPSQSLTFEERSEPEIDPRLMGLMLGDGCFKNKNLSYITEDKILADYVVKSSNRLGLNCKIGSLKGREHLSYVSLTANSSGISNGNPIRNLVRSYNLMETGAGDKFIPDDYKYGSVNTRRQLLAGMIDSDGSLNKEVGFDWISKSETLAKDFAFVARSLGLRATVYVKTIDGYGDYYRVYLAGATETIPTLLDRKRARKSRGKSPMVSGFDVEPLDEGMYYGFQLSGDHLYMTEDFTVHHNSGKSWMLATVGANAVRSGYDVAHYSLELSETQTGLRYDSIFSGYSPSEVRQHKQEVIDAVNELEGNLSITYWPTKSASTQTIFAHVERLKSLKWKPDLILVDYAGIMKPMGQFDSNYEAMGDIYTDLRQLSGELQIPVWTASQTQRSAIRSDVIEADQIADSYKKVMISDFVCSISRKKSDKLSNTARFHVIKSRFGQDGGNYPAVMDTGTGEISIYEEDSDMGRDLMRRMDQSEDEVLKKEMSRKYEQFKAGRSTNKLSI